MIDETIFAELEDLLVDVIPPRVAACDLPEPAYCLRVFYDGLDIPEDDYVTRMRLVGVSVREHALDTRGKHAPDGIWMADNTDLSDHHRNIVLKGDAEVRRLCSEIYRLLTRNEDATLSRLRQATREICLRLNRLDWTSRCTVTDDFIVFPADGCHAFYDDYGDLAGSVPADRIKLLHDRGYLGPANNRARL